MSSSSSEEDSVAPTTEDYAKAEAYLRQQRERQAAAQPTKTPEPPPTQTQPTPRWTPEELQGLAAEIAPVYQALKAEKEREALHERIVEEVVRDPRQGLTDLFEHVGSQLQAQDKVEDDRIYEEREKRRAAALKAIESGSE